MTKRLLVASILCCVVAGGSSAAMARADDAAAARYKSLSETAGPALVTLKYVLKAEAGGAMSERLGRLAEEGQDTEITGLMMEPTGLVLVSNASLSGGVQMAMMSRFMGSGFTVNPTDLKVLVGEDAEGLKAKVLARDTDLDLAWIQIDDPKAAGKTFAAVDFAASAVPKLGDRLYTVERMAKFFDHAIMVSEARVGGMTRKPRALYIPTGAQSEPGMPMFDEEGKVVGVGVLQIPSKEDVEGGDMRAMMSGGGFGFLLLPSEEVIKATKRTKAIAEKAGSESAPATDAPAATPAENAEKK